MSTDAADRAAEEFWDANIESGREAFVSNLAAAFRRFAEGPGRKQLWDEDLADAAQRERERIVAWLREKFEERKDNPDMDRRKIRMLLWAANGIEAGAGGDDDERA